MRHLESVERVTDTLSRWRAKGPARHARRVERRNHQRGAEPGDRLAFARRLGRGVGRVGRTSTTAAGQHAAARPAAVQPAGREDRRRGRRLMGRDAATEIPGRPAAVQAAGRERPGVDERQLGPARGDYVNSYVFPALESHFVVRQGGAIGQDGPADGAHFDVALAAALPLDPPRHRSGPAAAGSRPSSRVRRARRDVVRHHRDLAPAA